jgi:hypothetical protein
MAEDPEADVIGVGIDLIANGGGIGNTTHDLDIDSSTPSEGRLYATADGSIYITETAEWLNVLFVLAVTGNVRLTVPDTAGTDEDLYLLAGGADSHGNAVAKGSVRAAGWIELRVGDDVSTSANSEIVAGTTITIYGDYLNADPSIGTVMELRSTIAGCTRPT